MTFFMFFNNDISLTSSSLSDTMKIPVQSNQFKMGTKAASSPNQYKITGIQLLQMPLCHGMHGFGLMQTGAFDIKHHN